MNQFDAETHYQPGEIVYVMYRNPHTQDVAHIQEAAVVENPEEPGEMALFLYETYYPLNEQLAIYKTENEAEAAYEYYFGDPEHGDINA
ncbi:transcriptional regulator SplA domain-containing protein [Salsuginibacillus kocurii]|uniref:transcriptional regulator SplA domain-containing protein n=1 Tax=Salsuginibacillus kocurii TaxID=427078 RepID=UPI00036555FB|nr:transcriptional regulator SplA domain-containing protein [Salsuginibacillus kocurii]